MMLVETGKAWGLQKARKFIDQLRDKYLWYLICNVGDTLCEPRPFVEMLCIIFRI